MSGSPIKKLAIIDLGTNSVRFDAYEVHQQEALRIHREKRMIKLGEGVFETGEIGEAAIDRVCNAFVVFKNEIGKLNIDRVIAFGTSALRSSANAEEVINKIKEASGIEIEVISGEREGQLIAEGVMAHLNLPDKKIALVDIGGGSTEVTITQGETVLTHASLELGAYRLQQAFLSKGSFHPDENGISPELELRQEVRNRLAVLSEVLADSDCKMVIGSSGTIRNLGKILKKAGKASQPFMRKDLAGLVSEMKVMSPQQIAKIPGLEPRRVELILAGALLFEEVMYFLGAKRFYITNIALRDGILVEALGSQYFSPDPI